MPITGTMWVLWLWINLRGELWKCSRERVRPAENEETAGSELTQGMLRERKETLKKVTVDPATWTHLETVSL